MRGLECGGRRHFRSIGGVIGRAAGLVERRQERARREHEARILDAQMRAKQQASEADLRLADTSGAWRGLEASLAAEAAIGESYQWGYAVRALTRPLLTLLLWLITGPVFLGRGAAARGEIFETATFAATAAMLWWLGHRGPGRVPR